jgi:hypothetical protein
MSEDALERTYSTSAIKRRLDAKLKRAQEKLEYVQKELRNLTLNGKVRAAHGER